LDLDLCAIGSITAASTPYLAFPHLGGRDSLKSAADPESDAGEIEKALSFFPPPRWGRVREGVDAAVMTPGCTSRKIQRPGTSRRCYRR
jgi:hypothetical protein